MGISITKSRGRGAAGSAANLLPTPSVTPSVSSGLTEAAVMTLVSQHSGPVVFMPETAAAPAVPGEVDTVEVQAWVDAQAPALDSDTLIRYTGTDDEADSTQRLYKATDGTAYFVSAVAALPARQQTIFTPETSPFDWNALGVADNTPIVIRNPDPINGITVTIGTGLANTLEATHANGIRQAPAPADSFPMQPSEIAIIEKEGTTVRVSIFPGERVSYFDDYAQANAFGGTAYDGIVIIRSTSEIWGRRSNTNFALFPADGAPDANWFKLFSSTTTDQAASWKPNTAYAVDDIISHAEQDPADDNLGDLFNWRVTTAIADNEFAVWDATTFSALQGKLERFAIAQLTAVDASTVVQNGVSIGLDGFVMDTGSTAKRWTIRDGETATFTKNSNPAIVEVIDPSSLATITDTGTTSRSVEVTGPATVEYQRNSSQFNVIILSLASSSGGGVKRITLDSGDFTFSDAAYTIDYSAHSEQIFESELFVVGERTITFNDPVIPIGEDRQSLTHRVYINANTDPVTVTFPAGTWKDAGGSTDAVDIVIPAGENRTLELSVWDEAGSEYVRVLGVGAGLDSGVAVERIVYQRNKGSAMTFGDLQFRVPSTGNQSMQFRATSGVQTISAYVTQWSNQQGGASENAFGFSLGSSWAYLRANGSLNLGLHNAYQEATFVCNGWAYNVKVIVGSGWANNRFSFTRWRLDGVKGDAGLNGVNGRGIVTSHRSDGVTPIGGTTYTLDHIIYEYTDSTFQDMGFLVAPAPVGLQAIELGAYSGASTTGQLIPLAGGRTWQDVLDEFQFVYVLIGGNNLYTHDQTVQFHVSDLTTPSRDMAITGYMTHGSNGYHMRLITPTATATTVSIQNDNTSMQVQRIKVMGIK